MGSELHATAAAATRVAVGGVEPRVVAVAPLAITRAPLQLFVLVCLRRSAPLLPPGTLPPPSRRSIKSSKGTSAPACLASPTMLVPCSILGTHGGAISRSGSLLRPLLRLLVRERAPARLHVAVVLPASTLAPPPPPPLLASARQRSVISRRSSSGLQ